MSSPLSDQGIRPSITDDDLSRILDNLRMIEDDKRGRTCQNRVFQARLGDNQTATSIRNASPECGKPATHQSLHTCCGNKVQYVCDEHAVPFNVYPRTTCRNCMHVCLRDVCYHRIITPL